MKARLGGLHSCQQCLLYAVDFAPVAALQHAGADLLLVCSNTMHKMADAIAAGAAGIVLGCTEIPRLISRKDTSLPIFGTTLIRARRAVDLARG